MSQVCGHFSDELEPLIPQFSRDAAGGGLAGTHFLLTNQTRLNTKQTLRIGQLHLLVHSLSTVVHILPALSIRHTKL